MVQATYNQLVKGFSFAGTFLYSDKPAAEDIAEMLGLSGAFLIETDDGPQWMPGRDYSQFMSRLNETWTDRILSHCPKTTRTLSFLSYLDTQ